jgi:hypothetical protein
MQKSFSLDDLPFTVEDWKKEPPTKGGRINRISRCRPFPDLGQLMTMRN